MTLPFENDTNPIVKKISKRNLKADKSRNVLIIITIALATCLIMATALYFLGSQRKSLNDAMGRYQAVINDIDNDKIEKLVNDDRVDVGVSHLLGMVSYGDFKLTVRSMDKTLMDLAKYPDLQGKLPETEKEVAITKAFLERTGLSKSVGDNISIDLGDGKKEYNLCGILPVDNSNYSLFVSQSYVASKISDPTYSAYVRLKGSDGWSKAAIQSELLTLLNDWGIQQENIQFSTYYFSLIEQRSSQYMLIIAFVCLIVTLACTLYLLASTPGRVYTYSQIYQLVWQEYPHGDIANIIYCMVHRLKRKLKKVDVSAEHIIISVKEVGYCLRGYKES